MAMGQDILFHGEALFVIATSDVDHITLPILHPEHQQQLLWPYASHKRYEVAFNVHFNKFLAASSFILKQPTTSEVPQKKRTLTVLKSTGQVFYRKSLK